MKTIKIGGEVVIEYVTTLLGLLLYSGPASPEVAWATAALLRAAARKPNRSIVVAVAGAVAAVVVRAGVRRGVRRGVGTVVVRRRVVARGVRPVVRWRVVRAAVVVRARGRVRAGVEVRHCATG